MTCASAPNQASPNREEKSFVELGVDPQICGELEKNGYAYPFQIQALTVPFGLKGNDIIGQAKTGTGKTLGFALPVLQKALALYRSRPASPHRPTSLIVLPTRELANQVAEVLAQITPAGTAKTCEVYGGTDINKQIRTLAKGCEIVVGTPGRIRDLIQRKQLFLDQIQILVLDEADEMLDMGFLPDVEKIFALTPDTRQTMLFSATMPAPIIALARRYMTKPMRIQAHDPIGESQNATANNIKHVIYRCHMLNKDEVLVRILQARERGLSIIFTHTKRSAQKLADVLNERGFAVGPLHGDMPQKLRERSLNALREGKIDVLVATDVAARGIDVDNVSHVINYQCPQDAKTFIHRTGRTGRAGQTGHAITFVDWEDVPRWKLINKEVGLEQADPVETYHTSPHLYADLDIPEDAAERLPRSRRTCEGLPGSGYSRPKTAQGSSSRPSRNKRAVKRPSEQGEAKKVTRGGESGETSGGEERKTRVRRRKTSRIHDEAAPSLRNRTRRSESGA